MAHLKHIREWRKKDRKKQYLGVTLSLLYFKPLDPLGQLTQYPFPALNVFNLDPLWTFTQVRWGFMLHLNDTTSSYISSSLCAISHF
jgi:hypothetical protein